MKLDRAVRLQNQAATTLEDVMSAASSFGLLSSLMEQRKHEALARIGVTADSDKGRAGGPRWLVAYCEGYWRALVSRIYRHELVFGCVIDGVFYSTHSNRPDYYEKHGFSPTIFSDAMDVNRGTVGHYWRGEKDKPFFISNPRTELKALQAGKARHETEDRDNGRS